MNISNDINYELQKHIDLVILELRTTSGARVIAAAAALEDFEDDEGCPDFLMEQGAHVLGWDAVYEGYDHDWSLGDATEFEDGRPILGVGISLPSYEAYLDLHVHFGAQWLEKTLMVGAATISEAKTMLEGAQFNYEVACQRHREARLREISREMADLAAEAERLAA